MRCFMRVNPTLSNMEAKNIIIRYGAIILLLLIIAFDSKAQQTGKITGRIIDSISANPVEYAAISLVKQDDNKIVNGATSDNKGMFELTGIPEGTYRLLIYFLGYKTFTKNNINITKNNMDNLLGDISLITRSEERRVGKECRSR